MTHETDVLIVGSGPTGLTVALALANYGVRSHIVSRGNWLADSPRAHITNQRANEVFRDLGIELDILHDASPWDLMGDTTFATSLAGPELVRMRTWGTGDDRRGDYLRASPCGMVDIIQPLLEPILLRKAAERGASFAFNTEYLRHEQDETGVTTFLQDRLTSREYEIRARYMVGADGARSAIVDQLNLPIEGRMARAGTVYTIFNADLSKYSAHRPSILNWIVTPDASFGEIGMGLLRAVRPWTQWIAGWGFDINAGDPDLSEAYVRGRIGVLIGDPSIEIDVVRTSVWYVNQAYATQYSHGRVFCGGDAVHRHPPSSGLGMNTCVQDAHNLAWKLAFAVKGYAGPGLLESYSAERAPVGKQIVLRANLSRVEYAQFNDCFRVPGAENPIAAGIALFRNPGPEGVARRRAIQEALDLKQTEFNAQGFEMNQRYRSSAVLEDSGAEPEKWLRDPLLYNQATTRPGAKIPHAWLVGRDGKRASTLDMTGRGVFTVVTGLAGKIWNDAAIKLDLPFLRTVVVGEPDAQDLYCEWQRVREVEEAGAILVRPDGVVAWRERGAIDNLDAAAAKLGEAVCAVLDIPNLSRIPRLETVSPTATSAKTKGLALFV
jgi:2,4-dichlorophenol 6-monooxygenase